MQKIEWLTAEDTPRRGGAGTRPIVGGLVAILCLLSACGLSNAGALADAGTTSAAPAVSATETPSPAPGDDSTGGSVDEVLDSLLLALGEAGYYGECPTVESTGLDPLSLEANTKLAEMTDAHHCAWIVEESSSQITLNLDRLDVFGDEHLYYVALAHSDTGWDFAAVSNRPSLGASANPNSVWLDDLLQST